MRVPPPTSILTELLVLLVLPVLCWGGIMFALAWQVLGDRPICYYDGAFGVVSPDGQRRAVRRNFVCEVWHQDNFEESQLVILPAGVPATEADTIAFTANEPFEMKWLDDRTVAVSVPIGAWLREYRYDVGGVRVYLDWRDFNMTVARPFSAEHVKSSGAS